MGQNYWMIFLQTEKEQMVDLGLKAPVVPVLCTHPPKISEVSSHALKSLAAHRSRWNDTAGFLPFSGWWPLVNQGYASGSYASPQIRNLKVILETVSPTFVSPSHLSQLGRRWLAFASGGLET